MYASPLILAAALVIGAAPLHAQRAAPARPAPVRAPAPAQAAGSPRAVAQRVLNALSSRDAAAFARDVHPQEMANFR